jgi:predicted alpha/beta-fold hydrolase
MSDASRRVAGTSLDFVPPWRLRNQHVQSIYPSLPLRRAGVERRSSVLRQASREQIVDCGDGVRLLALVATQVDAGRPPSDRLAVLLHGWEGSANSLYLLSLGQNLFDAGYDVARLNLRDHGDSHHLNSGIFHSCRIAEVVGAVRELQRQHPGERLVLAGFSLGGNFCLRVGARAADAGIDVSRIVAVCPVIDPEHTLTRLESGWALYREYFVWKWRRSLRKKREAWPDVYHSLDDILELGNLTEMTHRLACGYGGFPSLPEYLRGYALVGRALEPLEALRAARIRIIAAEDDPIIPAADLNRVARPSVLEITRTRHGGHCGYYEGAVGPTWVERQILASFEPGEDR